MSACRIITIGLSVSGLALLAWWMTTIEFDDSEQVAREQGREIEWEELIPEEARGYDIYAANSPEGQLRSQLLEPGTMPTGDEVSPELNDQQVRLPGYVVPITADGPGTVQQFLLVPYMGACMHLPPPPPNQIVYVELREPFELRSLWEPFWVDGIMRVESQHLGIASAAYSIKEAEMVSYFTKEG